MKEASVIIVSFNSLLVSTKPCLESLFQNTAGLDYEVIVVDNGSQDGTQEFLKLRAGAEPRLRYIANPSNLGYAAANNIGLAAAQGECLVLLNSDTLVTDQSLAKLARFLRANPDVGLAGPVTNFTGNEQRIFIEGSSVADTLAQGQVWTANSQGDLFRTERLNFFCVAMRRDHFKRVGPLDEAFGLGFFEDDDYCLRSMRAEFGLVCLEDAFVYHCGSQSFNEHASAEVTALMKKNRRLLEQKLGQAYRPRRPCERQLDLVRHYLRHADERSRPRMLFKAWNRLNMARACRPKSPAKKLWFHLRWLRLEREVRHLTGPSLATAPSIPNRSN